MSNERTNIGEAYPNCAKLHLNNDFPVHEHRSHGAPRRGASDAKDAFPYKEVISGGLIDI